jgi:hypothetical protein
MRRWVILIVSAMFAATLNGAEMIIRAWDREDYSGSVRISAGTRSSEMRFAGTGKNLEVRLPIDPGITSITVEGEVRWKHYRKGSEKAKGKQTIRIIDLASVVRPLRDRSRPVGQRVIEYLDANRRFGELYPEMGEVAAVLERGTAASPAEIVAAEKRLGFALPDEHKNLLFSIGQLMIDDSSTVAATRLNRADVTIIEDWGTPKEALKEVVGGTPTDALLRRSTLLVTEAGDGYGGVLFDPKSAECGDRPAYLWIHQETMNSPLVIRGAGGGCADYTEALIWTLAQLALLQYEDHTAEVMLFDSSSPTPFRSWMMFDSPGKLEMKFTPEWKEFR